MLGEIINTMTQCTYIIVQYFLVKHSVTECSSPLPFSEMNISFP